MGIRQEDLGIIHEITTEDIYDEARERARPISQEQLAREISSVAFQQEVSLDFLIKHSDSPFIRRGGDYDGGAPARLGPADPKDGSGSVALDIPIAA